MALFRDRGHGREEIEGMKESLPAAELAARVGADFAMTRKLTRIT